MSESDNWIIGYIIVLKVFYPGANYTFRIGKLLTVKLVQFSVILEEVGK